MVKFEGPGFTPGILNAFKEPGFEQPVPIQKKVIPLMLRDENDIIDLTVKGAVKLSGLYSTCSSPFRINKTAMA